ncbi:MAG: hypothetical protein KDE56_16830 [Anaerolineales bacterium]|nr:hypothetical protein [Anaerolineales bacterium]
MKHIKGLWGYYLVLFLLLILLTYPIHWIYIFFQIKFGQEAALIALSLAVMIVLIFIVRGAVHTHRLVRDLKQGRPAIPPDGQAPLILRLFRIDPRIQVTESLEAGMPAHASEFANLFKHPRKRNRGKPPRFPEADIRKAVLKWERRDPSTTALTLEQFLAQEFGSSPDGVLLMATTTFYDWRRRILKEIEEHEQQP